MVENTHNSATVVIFEGIATVDVDGVAHDTYMSIRTEAVGQTIRWFGSYEWMGDGPPADAPTVPATRDIVLSDGREAKIHVPHRSSDGARLEFLGIGMPPGFEWFTPEHITDVELTSTTPSVWRRLPSKLLGVTSLGFLGASFWIDGRATELAGTAFCLIVAAIAFTPRRGRALPEVPRD